MLHPIVDNGLHIDVIIYAPNEKYPFWKLVATFVYNNTHITFSHSFELENKDSDDEMIVAFIEFPQIIGTIKILRCKIGLMKTVACL